jgi:ureidoglycolate dehydrogenase (NAD+)
MPEILVAADHLAAKVTERLREAGVSEASTAATVRALLHASRVGVDSHGVRLVPHYCNVVGGGRVNGTPDVTVRRTGPATAIVDGDDGLGHLTAYRANGRA